MPDQNRRLGAPVLAALIVVLVVAGFVVAQALSGRDDGGPPVTSAEESRAPTPPPGECVPPPAPPRPTQFDQAPAAGLAEDSVWTATVATNCGEIVLELYGDKAPQTVSSFLFLARKGFFDDSPCHRLVTKGIYVLQCGDPTGTGTGGPGYTFELENAPADQTYPRGTLAMARTMDPDSNGSQFFIVYQKTRLPDPGYSVFGTVVSGMEVIDRIAEAGVAETSDSRRTPPAQPISILDITLEKQQ